MKRLIVTGPNGAGKSYIAAQLAAARPDVPVISFDAIKLTNNWKQRPKSEIDAELLRVVQKNAWILEGGPSLLPHAIKYADSVMWLDPSAWLRAWRLALRPLQNIGRTRPELPAGNIDLPWEQYKFAARSLRKSAEFRDNISKQLAVADGVRIWHIRNAHDLASAINEWRNTPH
ncbi:DNA topology modulation protein FlaR [Agrobacterium vitis]|uniref:DNA topology modulation protein FlaR n=1 Tax=Agrobacterium vitis TaxID=373 RepID=A0AAE4W9U7_AGRVI|nr:DNA topology modulation protein FlaR [Agrobacterium vitis]MCF1497796.1 DNA topology modulation protein FlaR [Allorhizobium sp. Av2]MCM2441313.1 DNA topology modulation protein FlaR [Agrobacterium vitis]MUZ55937.1 DNA topology modulation protein FlaR [Agrobacterium vitis]MVA68745.1 DNA topology modulation protein FlaR [Agrobacterium vitis]MVA89521.1 DNA topology modulation protein FlaR [Agrobacterium vitis]